MKCRWCEESILPQEVMPHAPFVQMHRECVLRSVYGSVGHLQHICSCYGGSVEDPPGFGKRDAARMAIIESMRQSAHTPIHHWPATQRAALRPSVFDTLPSEEQWSIDRALGLLDWKGTVLS